MYIRGGKIPAEHWVRKEHANHGTFRVTNLAGTKEAYIGPSCGAGYAPSARPCEFSGHWSDGWSENRARDWFGQSGFRVSVWK